MLQTSFTEKLTALLKARHPFVMATIIRVRGSSSGRLGDRALFDSSGQCIAGWIGGGCVERMTGDLAREALDTGEVRHLTINLDGEDILYTIPCGGEIEIMVEPNIPQPALYIRGSGRIVEELVKLAANHHYTVMLQGAGELEMIDAHLERLPAQVSLDELTPKPDYAVLASHHPDEHLRAGQLLKAGVPYVALIASRKRASLIQEALIKDGLDESLLAHFYAPAGLDLGDSSSAGIALSIFAQIVTLQHAGSGQPLHTLAAVSSERETPDHA